MSDQEEGTAPESTPITVEGIFDHALAGTDLPAREDRSLAAYVASFDDPELVRRLEELVSKARVADVNAARHWGHQAETRYLETQPGGKSPSHR